MAKLAMDDPFFLSTALRWYKRKEVQEAIVAACEQREVSPRYGEGFGKRPDALLYPQDVLSFVTKRATSFHCSEERWRDPLRLVTGASRKEQDDLRIGWDLVLDVDCPYWHFSKLTTWLFLQALRDHTIASASVKFSGNKGFHVGVPFEAFPAETPNGPTKDLFPEAPRAIAKYLPDYVSDPHNKLIVVRNNTIVFGKKYKVSYEKLKEVTGKDSSELVAETCRRCGTKRERSGAALGTLFLCTSCGHTTRTEKEADFLKCERCNGVMEPQRTSEKSRRCTQCGAAEFEPRFNVAALIQVDTILIASRHLFRAPYSLHEKSGLASVVFPPERIMEFEKEEAKPEKVKEFRKFLDSSRTAKGEAAELLLKSLDLASRSEQREQKEYAIPEEAIPEELFPPCVKLMFNGMVDGKKRAMFALTNFLRSCGWGHEQIEARLHDWNRKNPEPLREVLLKGHLRYTKQKKEVVLPPNCKSFYQDLGVCHPDNFCQYIKNPAQYSRLKAERIARGKAPAEAKKGLRLTDEQKEMRRRYREGQKTQTGKN